MKQLLYEAIDWNAMWQQANQKKSWKSKGQEDWDKRAASFAKRTAGTVYSDQFIQRLQPEKNWSVLDVGSGPGTLALSLAEKVQKITCIDYSAEMLRILTRLAREKNLDNITPCLAAWDDDWQACHVQPHDVAIASRSLSVQDLRACINRLNQYAVQQVVITDKVRHGPFDPQAFKALGRPLQTGPDYIYTVNLLYQMGYTATVDFIRMKTELLYASLDDALAGYLWMFRDITDSEKNKLKKYLQSITTTNNDGSLTVHRRNPVTWAYISWQP